MIPSTRSSRRSFADTLRLITVALAIVGIFAGGAFLVARRGVRLGHEAAIFYAWLLAVAGVCAFLLLSAVVGRERARELILTWLSKIFRGSRRER